MDQSNLSSYINQPCPPFVPQNTFTPYNSGYQNQIPNGPIAQQNSIRYEIARVKGYDGAIAFPMGPNSSIFLADADDGHRIWLAMTDGAGYKTVRPINASFDDIKEEEDKLDVLIKRLDRMEEMVNDKFNNRNVKSKQPATSPES